ncbi:hypothetical protein [Desulfatirhabdium butyrativorans]|uniref:hypothetical protein n=1 Tax=Desulfatirhabdium butyrativorans TaxID=340467 RepID=UPI0004805826|nr:hypothetical protein [Desulfatirhabdium butyrativorans]
MPADADTPWKEVLECYFEEFIGFFFPNIYPQIDWGKPHEFLDKELQKALKDAKIGKRIVDKLVKVHRKDGQEQWVLVHVEVQGEEEADFAKRMYVYNYRLFDRYDKQVASLAVLTDDRPGWRPDGFEYELFGCRVGIRFPMVKLLDFAERWDELSQSSNLFAVVVMAHLKFLETRHAMMDRLQWKIQLVRQLFDRGYSRKDIINLFRFIDWIMCLPEELDRHFSDTIRKLEEEKKMPYVTSVERLGIKKGIVQGLEEGLQLGRQEGMQLGRQEGMQLGRQEGMQLGRQEGMQLGRQEGMKIALQESICDVLKLRFGKVSKGISSAIAGIQDSDTLKTLHQKAVFCESLKAFQAELKNVMVL